MTKPTNLQHFHKFWSVVWLKVGKLDAERKFYIALKREPAEFIIEAAKAYTEKIKGKKERRYTIHPATWLHKGRFYDEDSEEEEFNALKLLDELDGDNASH